MQYDLLSIGGIVRDVLFVTRAGSVIANQQDLLRERLLAFEYGAKIYSREVTFSLGGGAANVAVASRLLGLRTGVIGATSRDAVGQALVDELVRKGVHGDGIQRTRQPAGFSFLVIDSASGDHTTFAFRGANDDLRITPGVAATMRASWYYLTSLSGPRWQTTLRQVVAAARQHQASLVWNPGSIQLAAGYRALRPILTAATIVNLNHDEARELILSARPRTPRTLFANTKKLIALLHELGIRQVLVTAGRAGAHFSDGAKLFFQPALSGKPVDTTGAGDCFGASFVSGLIRCKGDVPRALRLAALNTQSLVREVGAQVGLLSWPVVRRRLMSPRRHS